MSGQSNEIFSLETNPLGPGINHEHDSIQGVITSITRPEKLQKVEISNSLESVDNDADPSDYVSRFLSEMDVTDNFLTESIHHPASLKVKSFFKNYLGFQETLDTSTPYDLGKLHQKSLLSSRKLVLIVDLDSTIIDSTKSEDAKLSKASGLFRYNVGKKYFTTKCRPHVDQFLSTLSEFYELHVFTFATKFYARYVITYLDRDKKYFQRRIQSLQDSVCKKHKFCNLKSMFPAGDNMVCIIDDSERVWKSAPNLIRVPPYNYFRQQTDLPSSSSSSSSSAPEDKEDQPDREKQDGYLLRLGEALLEIHDSFYKQHDANPNHLLDGKLHLKTVISQRKSEVLDMCTIVFEKLYSIAEIKVGGFWFDKVALAYGAGVRRTKKTGDPDAITHVVAVPDLSGEMYSVKDDPVTDDPVTDDPGIAYVNIDWLLNSIEHLEKADESLYPISKMPSNRWLDYVKFQNWSNDECIL